MRRHVLKSTDTQENCTKLVYYNQQPVHATNSLDIRNQNQRATQIQMRAHINTYDLLQYAIENQPAAKYLYVEEKRKAVRSSIINVK